MSCIDVHLSDLYSSVKHQYSKNNSDYVLCWDRRNGLLLNLQKRKYYWVKPNIWHCCVGTGYDFSNSGYSLLQECIQCFSNNENRIIFHQQSQLANFALYLKIYHLGNMLYDLGGLFLHNLLD